MLAIIYPLRFAPLDKEPWPPTLFEHKKALGGWATRMKSFAGDQSLSFQAWIFYRLRFIISAEVCSAWDSFGGFIDQINNIGVALNIAISENVGTSLKYFEFLHTQLESYARSRATDIDYYKLLSEEQQEIKRRFSKTPPAGEGSPSSNPSSKSPGKSNFDNWYPKYYVVFSPSLTTTVSLD